MIPVSTVSTERRLLDWGSRFHRYNPIAQHCWAVGPEIKDCKQSCHGLAISNESTDNGRLGPECFFFTTPGGSAV